MSCLLIVLGERWQPQLANKIPSGNFVNVQCAFHAKRNVAPPGETVAASGFCPSASAGCSKLRTLSPDATLHSSNRGSLLPNSVV